jgi:diguanylate cyclase (GGDEF)-like protein
VLMLDIDHFKQFNDRFGHETGDRVLKEVGRVLRERVRESDLVARFGGEEFSIVLPDIDQAGAIALAEQLRAGVEHIDLRGAELGTGEGAISVSISIGLAVLASPGIRPADLLRAADRALYDAKHRGRNRVSVAERLGDTVQVRGVGVAAVPPARVAAPAPTLDYAAAAGEPPGSGAP